MSTTSVDLASGLRQRTCAKAACSTAIPAAAPSQSSRCCEESCLVEIARRECDTECNDDSVDTRQTTTNQPCARHYGKTKDAYGAILDNLGCICKVLLSLNIESCCVLPSHASLRSKRSSTASLVAKAKVHGTGSRTSVNSSQQDLALESKPVDDCSKKGCCGGGAPAVVPPNPVPEVTSSMVKDCADESCCSGAPSKVAPELSKASEKVDDCSKKGCCSGTPSKVAPELSKASEKGDDCSKNGCCSGTSSKLALEPSKASEKGDDCSKKGCCSGGVSSAPARTIPELRSSKVKDCSDKSCCIGTPLELPLDLSVENEKADDCSKKGCCSGATSPPPARASPEITAKNIRDCSKQSCCNGASAKPVSATNLGNSSVKDESCSKQNCCSSNDKARTMDDQADDCCSDAGIDVKTPRALKLMASNCSGKSCCSGSASEPISTATEQKTKYCCSKEGNCAGENSFDSCARTATKSTKIVPVTLRSIGDVDTASFTITRADDFDVENGQFEVEHIVLGVSGMTCTGCEKKLHKTLSSLPALSNIKTSLVLAQAEFDFLGASSISSVDLIRNIERMTGFTCTKVENSGEELDLIVTGRAKEFINQDWPHGIVDLTVLGKNSIRVTFNAKVVGARELLSDPFFRLAEVAPVSVRPAISAGRAHVRWNFLMTLISAILTTPVLVLAWAPLPEREVLYGAISLGLATIVQTVVAGPFYVGALKALIFSHMIEMDLLIVLSTTTAYVYSAVAYAYLVAGNPLSTGQFFETSTLLVTLIMVGRSISAYARQRAVESISIESLQATCALIIDPKTKQDKEIDARLLQYGDVFKVLPDAAIVTDGIVAVGQTEVDESMVTGESTLVPKGPGDSVIAGSVNHSGTLLVQLTRLPSENTIKTIGIMVDEAKSSKPTIQAIADRVAGVFVIVILVIAVIVFLIWVVVGKAVRHQSTAIACIVAMTYSISTLIVSCPCAIGLAVPMVVVIAGGVAAKHGLIFKTAETIQIARNVSHVIFDKTGTLTQGKLSVEVEEYPAEKFDLLAPVILGLSSNSKHPVSLAIATHLEALGFEPSHVENIVSVPGNGVEATWNGKIVRAGNPHWLNCSDLPKVQEILSHGLSMFCVSIDNTIVAIFGLKDLLRPDALSIITQLQNRSIAVSLVSGDHETAVHSIANQLGIPFSHVRARCTPAAKQLYVQTALSSPHNNNNRPPVVLFCGDGTNDAIALAQATIGVHVNSGTDIAQSAADAVLLRPSLAGILTLIDLSKAFYRRVVFNFAWSFIYNVFAILLAAGAFPNARIEPRWAGLGELISVVPVVLVAMGLKLVKF